VRAFATLRYEKRGAVAVVTLDRPEVLNAYDVAMRDELYAALGAADEDPELRALVLTGRGPAFSTGGDVYLGETAAPARAWLYRARTLLRAGIPLAGASDAPVVPPSPWVGIAAARARRTAAGVTLGAAERLGARAALRLFTTGAAFALGADRLGMLAPGGPADLVVVEPDPLRAPPDEVADARVRLTLVAGERVWPA